jgi:hypothetical protein
VRPPAPATLEAVRRPEAGRAGTRLAPSGLLQRACACGGIPGPDGECASCREKRLQREAAASGPALAPPIVHEVLAAPGRPLDASMRSFFEPRIGYDLGSVRVHTDERAHASAQAVGATAYTVGPDVVFSSGAYAPGTHRGRSLLAHELVHVAQQRARPVTAGDPVEIGHPESPLEREADDGAAHAVSDRAAATERSTTSVLQREVRDPATRGSPPPAPAPAPAPPTTFVCGPDVTPQVRGVVAAVRSAWGGWNSNQRGEACWALENIDCGPVAWDIVQLHNNAWIYQDYRPACASAGANPRCGSSVKVGPDCHNAGSVNYVIFGAMCDLCDIWRTTMHLMIWVHKVHLSGMDADYDAAVRWADAGYGGWPSAGTPAGDRTNCAATCPTPFGATAHNPATTFDFHWYPPRATETVGSDCPTSLDLYRVQRDSAPMPDWGGIGF